MRLLHIGNTGDSGSDGAQGPSGQKGQKGERGFNGADGQKGNPGESGSDGAAGQKGQKGDSGVQGTQGRKGEVGPSGNTGPAGSQGMFYYVLHSTGGDLVFIKILSTQNFLGFTMGRCSVTVNPVELQTRMFCGFKGFRVLWYNFMTKTNFEIVLVLLLFILIAYAIPVYQKIHCKGLKKSMMRCICMLSCLFLGQKGERGFDGVAGATGQKGERGFQGSQGQKGERGVSGSQGSQGSRGATGNTGPAGSRGATGFQGPQGSTVSSQGCKSPQANTNRGELSNWR